MGASPSASVGRSGGRAVQGCAPLRCCAPLPLVAHFPSLAHFSSGGSHQGGPAAFQDTPPAPTPQPQSQKATPSYRPPCPKKAPRPDTPAAGAASLPLVSPPPRDTCPAPEARNGHRLPAHPVFVAAVSGDAGLPARKRPAPGIPWLLLPPTAVQTVRTPAAASTEAADRQAWKCGKAPQRLRRQPRQSGHSSGGTLPHSHTTPLPTLRGPAYACGSAPSAHRSYSISSNSPGNHLPPTSDKHPTPRLKSGYGGGGTQSSNKHGPTSVCYAAKNLALCSAAARRLSCPGRKGPVI